MVAGGGTVSGGYGPGGAGAEDGERAVGPTSEGGIKDLEVRAATSRSRIGQCGICYRRRGLWRGKCLYPSAFCAVGTHLPLRAASLDAPLSPSISDGFTDRGFISYPHPHAADAERSKMSKQDLHGEIFRRNCPLVIT